MTRPTDGVSAAHPPQPRASYLLRGVRSLGFGVVIGTGLWALRGDSFWYTMAYSLSIAGSSWFLIDSGRLTAARWLKQRSLDPKTGSDQWPGWPWMIAIVVIGSCLGYIIGTAFVNWLTGEHSPNLFQVDTLRQALSLLLLALIPAIAITYFFYSRGLIAAREADVLTAQRQAAEHQLKLLESQLEPHMLFNTLANLRVLIGIDPARAQAMLDQLIAFLRATLAGSRASQHPLSAEFARLGDYLALMQVRMGERLQTRFELPAALADTPVPPLLLQPLVENGIKHGLEPAVAGGRIDVSAVRDGADLLLRVRDTGAGLSEHSDGDATTFGLTQVRERLSTLYGTRASLTLSAAADAEGGTLATIRLPLSIA
jgi:sensor histidine kinase YesM